MKLEELRKAHKAAVERMQSAFKAIDEAADDITPEALVGLDEEFKAAKDEVERTKANLAEHETRARLVHDNPVPDVADVDPPVNHDAAKRDVASVVRDADSGVKTRKIQVPNTNYPKGVKIEVGKEDLTYERHKEYSYFGDLYAAKEGDEAARKRLDSHKREMLYHLQRDRKLKQFRAINETSGTGGEFVPPLWMNEEFIHFLRPARATADLCNHMPLPEHTNTINFPSVTGGTAVAPQTDGTGVQSTDITTSSVAVPVRTIAGQQDLARQLLERSVPGMDRVLMEDLLLAYNQKLDTQVLNGSGTAPNALGIANTSSIGAVTYTQTTPALGGAGGFAAKVASAENTVATTRFLPADAIVMHPRRWYWTISQSDSQNRPLVVPTADGAAVNTFGIGERVAAQARAGILLGLPVILDPNVITTDGAGTNQDQVFVLRAGDLWLMEDAAGPYVRVYEEVLSGNLQIRVQLYNYFAFTAARYPSSVALITGTGLVTPTF